jgi:hypothetical protein
MTATEQLGQPEYRVTDPTLQDLTTQFDGYLLGDNRTQTQVLDNGSVRRTIGFDNLLLVMTVSSVSSPAGTTYTYTRRDGPGSLLSGGAMLTSLEWADNAGVAKTEQIRWGELNKGEATSADYRKASIDVTKEFGDIQRSVPKKLHWWSQAIGRLVRAVIS